MNSSISITLAPDVSSHFLDNEIILFSESQQRLYRLNTTAAFIWCCLEERQPVPEIIQSLLDTFQITKSSAEHDLKNTFELWESSGLITQQSGGQFLVSEFKPEAHEALEYELAVPAPDAESIRRTYQLIDTVFKVSFATVEVEAKVHPILAHLAVESIDHYDKCLDIVRNERDYVLLLDGTPIDYCAESSGLVPMMHANILMAAYDESKCLLAIHAGAVSKEERCILLPAVSGSGKSTLTAALLTEGYRYCTDDLALLSQNEHRIYPVPVSLGLKQGSWPILVDRFPNVEQLETHKRGDEKLVRYLPPPEKSLIDDASEGYLVSAIVFPKYQSNVRAKLLPLSPAEGLCRVAEAGYDVRGRLDYAKVNELVQWISGIECYSLEYDQLTDAAAMIRTLF